MHYELRSIGISVTAACPGFTHRCHPETGDDSLSGTSSHCRRAVNRQTSFWKPDEEPLGAKIPCLLQQAAPCAAQCVEGMFARKPYVVTGNVGGLFNRFLVTVGQMNSEDFGCWFVNTLWRLPKKA